MVHPFVSHAHGGLSSLFLLLNRISQDTMNLMSRSPVLFAAFQRSTTLELQPCFISIHVHELRSANNTEIQHETSSRCLVVPRKKIRSCQNKRRVKHRRYKREMIFELSKCLYVKHWLIINFVSPPDKLPCLVSSC